MSDLITGQFAVQQKWTEKYRSQRVHALITDQLPIDTKIKTVKYLTPGVT